MGQGKLADELRKKGDKLNNCYFSLASALNLKYFYQTCVADNPGASTQKSNLIVNIDQLKYNLNEVFRHHNTK